MNLNSYDNRGIQFAFTQIQQSETQPQENAYHFLCKQEFCDIDSIYQNENIIISQFCEGIGSIHFSFEPNQISGWVDTCLLGPGFHRIMILLLEQMKVELGLTLMVQDASGFYLERDFPKLQHKYTEYLFTSLLALSNSGEQSFLDKEKILPSLQGIEMPIRTEKILSPTGAFSAEYVSNITDDEEKINFASDYFLWFEMEQEEKYDLKFGIFNLWNKQINSTQENSFSIGTAVTGYRNGELLYKLPKGWWITVPGAFEPEYCFTSASDSEQEEQMDFPVYFLLEEMQIRILYSYCAELEQWRSLNAELQEIRQHKGSQSQLEKRKKYVCQKLWNHLPSRYEWTGEVFIDGRVLVLEAEGKSDALMNLMQQILFTLKMS